MPSLDRVKPQMTSLSTLNKFGSQLRSDFKKALGLLNLTASLPKFFRERATVGQAEEVIKKALEDRNRRFLELASSQIYERPRSTYLQLLKFAGCDFSDLRAYVQFHGLENALRKLATEGVYLTSDEFKGKKEIVRGGFSFRVSQAILSFRSLGLSFIFRAAGQRINLFPAQLPWIG